MFLFSSIFCLSFLCLFTLLSKHFSTIHCPILLLSFFCYKFLIYKNSLFSECSFKNILFLLYRCSIPSCWRYFIHTYGICIYVCVCVCMCIFIYIWLDVYVCVCIYIYIILSQLYSLFSASCFDFWVICFGFCYS